MRVTVQDVMERYDLIVKDSEKALTSGKDVVGSIRVDHPSKEYGVSFRFFLLHADTDKIRETRRMDMDLTAMEHLECDEHKTDDQKFVIANGTLRSITFAVAKAISEDDSK